MDRMVHATRVGVGELVRYNRAGKWYWEPFGCKRTALSLTDAVEKALWCAEAGQIHLRQPGGTLFDSRVKQALAAKQE